ncbi:hypothetical protein GX48_01785 [Paracoccidioides brasiliensis]|nr:hypothetical protein GX48_01785 [Paracoccidioides brasiliensis]
MSDDDDYYDDVFDGDWLWIEYGERELVDDLAEGTVHSPVYYMDHGPHDAIDSDSDWEYYTDEYFDDDLSVMHKQNILPPGTSKARKRKQQVKKQPSPPATPKTKETMTADGTDDGKDANNPNSYCKIIYRSSFIQLADQAELYKPGTGEKVALLKNWREIFKDSQPKRDYRLQKAASRLSPSASFAKSKSGRKRGHRRNTESGNVDDKGFRNVEGDGDSDVDVDIDEEPVFDGDQDIEEGSELGSGSGDDESIDERGSEERLTPPPSFLSASQQVIYEESRAKPTQPSRHNSSNNNGDKSHLDRRGSYLKSVMSAVTENDGPESSIPGFSCRSTHSSPQNEQGYEGEELEEPDSLIQDGYEADIGDINNTHGFEQGHSPTPSQHLKRKASSPLPSADGSVDGKERSKRAATAEKLDGDGSYNKKENARMGVGKKIAKDAQVQPATGTARRSLRERK